MPNKVQMPKDHQLTAKMLRDLTNVVSISTAKLLFIKGFPQPKAALGQIWITEKGEIINCYGKSHLTADNIYLGETAHWRILQGNQEREFPQPVPNLDVYMPNDEDIKNEMEGWDILPPGLDGFYKCYLIDNPENNYQDKNKYEAWAKAWKAEKGKDCEGKE